MRLAEGETRLARPTRRSALARRPNSPRRARQGRVEEATLKGLRQRHRIWRQAIRDAPRPTPARRRWRSPGSQPMPSCPRPRSIEAKVDRLEARARAARRRQPARRGGSARGRGAASTACVNERDDLRRRSHRLRGGIQSLNREGRERLTRGVRARSTDTSRSCSPRCSAAARAELKFDRIRRSARSRPRDLARPPGKRPTADAAVGRRAGADGDVADLRGVPHQPVADLRARRGGRAARRRQCRALLQPAATRWRDAPRRASWSSPTTRSPWPRWTGCSA